MNYLKELKKYIKKIKNVKDITFLPYHKLGIEKYRELNLDYPLDDIEEMDKDKCDKLYQQFLELKKQLKNLLKLVD